MFVYSLRAKKLGIAGGVVLAALALLLAIVLVPKGKSAEALASAGNARSLRFDGVETEEDLLDFIGQFGIEVKTPAYRSIDVDLPRLFDAVYKKYNDLQKQQGFDLSKYRGRTLHRYTYEITNYPPAQDGKDGKVYLTLFVNRGKVVGGDISSSERGGLVRSFIDFGQEAPENGQGESETKEEAS